MKTAVSSRFGRMMQAVIFEGYQDVGRYLQKNEKGDVIEIWKNRLLKPGQFSRRMFSAQHNKHQSHNKDVTPYIPPAASPSQTLQQVKSLFEKQTQVAHDLGELLRLKTKQIDKYGHVSDSKSNLYRRH